MRIVALVALLASTLAACAPTLPNSVTAEALDGAIADAIGDPGTCVLLGKTHAGGPGYRFGSAATCERQLPTCSTGTQSASDLWKMVARSGQGFNASCPTLADGSRSVGWAAGPVETTDLSYTAVMEGTSTPPGVVIADKLKAVWAKVGLSRP